MDAIKIMFAAAAMLAACAPCEKTIPLWHGPIVACDDFGETSDDTGAPSTSEVTTGGADESVGTSGAADSEGEGPACDFPEDGLWGPCGSDGMCNDGLFCLLAGASTHTICVPSCNDSPECDLGLACEVEPGPGLCRNDWCIHPVCATDDDCQVVGMECAAYAGAKTCAWPKP